MRYGEGVIASILNDLLVKFPELMLGSYPVLDNPDYKVKVTLESKDSTISTGRSKPSSPPCPSARPPDRIATAMDENSSWGVLPPIRRRRSLRFPA